MKSIGTLLNQNVVRHFYDHELGIITYKEGKWFDGNNQEIVGIKFM